MSISNTILNIRFGYGFSPNIQAMDNIDWILRDLTKPDELAKNFQTPSFTERLKKFDQLQQIRKEIRKSQTKDRTKSRKLQKRLNLLAQDDVKKFLIQAALDKNSFKQRLVAFWHDNFSVSSKNLQLGLANGAYINEAIRPNIAGNFANLLKQAITHPAMLIYLDQFRSIGENSPIGKKRKSGLNENLAREILELHTMGVKADYTQTDVREFAKLLTGLTINKKGFTFNPKMSEPGIKTIFGKKYGAKKPKLEHIYQFLDDLAMNEQTAKHIAKKLAIHFVSEQPTQQLVNHIANAYLASNADLLATYKALLEHEESQKPILQKVKPPLEYVISSIRALGLSNELAKINNKDFRKLYATMKKMGQELFRAKGPDGWSEKANYWITPPNLAERINWASNLAFKYGQKIDPRELIKRVLNENASPELIHAVGDTENKWEGIALLLISPEFNRR